MLPETSAKYHLTAKEGGLDSAVYFHKIAHERDQALSSSFQLKS